MHIRRFNDRALAKMIWREQVKNNWPGPTSEAADVRILV